jgi:amidase
VSLKPPLAQPVGDEARAAVEQMASTLTSLGHRVTRRDPDYLHAIPHMMVRYASGSRRSARALAHPGRLERKTATILRLGRLVPDRAVARSRAQETGLVARLGRVFEDADVLLTPVTARPPIEVGHWADRGGLWTLNGASRLTMNPMLASWNLTGQPAAAVPAGLSGAGLPLGVQLVGRAGDEATLLSLSAQLQAELEWPARRPPV